MNLLGSRLAVAEIKGASLSLSGRCARAIERNEMSAFVCPLLASDSETAALQLNKGILSRLLTVSNHVNEQIFESFRSSTHWRKLIVNEFNGDHVRDCCNDSCMRDATRSINPFLCIVRCD